MARDVARAVDDDWLKTMHGQLFPSAKVASWKEWATEVRGIQVNLYPGGRAVLNRPGANWSVEIHFRTPAGGKMFVTECYITSAPDGFLFHFGGTNEPGDISVGTYITALYLALILRSRAGNRWDPEETTLPAAGKPPSVTFYKALLDEYAELIRETNPRPVQVLAERYGKPAGTVKSWLHRARKLEEESNE